MREDEEIIIKTGRRLALQRSNFIDDWYMSYSPRNDNGNAEGNWKEWVEFAKKIIEKDKESSEKNTGVKQ